MSDIGDNSKGCIGYIASRPIGDHRVPQHIQNLVIRDYCARRNLKFKLSATEYAMEHCYMMLDKLTAEIAEHDGMIAYSMFMLPKRAQRRREIYDHILAAGGELHAAAEDISLRSAADIDRWEDILMVDTVLHGSSPEHSDKEG